jgi:2-dehydro-3-deoxyphosphogluconate aldolase/(4S)-4-hydroxy-2-oxoglutarate aldolase
MEMQNAIELFNMRVAHVGINAADEKQAAGWAEDFLRLMGLPVRETPISYFNGELVEIMKQNGRGQNGHIGFAVNDCEAAMDYFVKKGLHLVEETKRIDDSGKCTFVYFKEEIGGFAIHLIQM